MPGNSNSEFLKKIMTMNLPILNSFFFSDVQITLSLAFLTRLQPLTSTKVNKMTTFYFHWFEPTTLGIYEMFVV